MAPGIPDPTQPFAPAPGGCVPADCVLGGPLFCDPVTAVVVFLVTVALVVLLAIGIRLVRTEGGESV